VRFADATAMAVRILRDVHQDDDILVPQRSAIQFVRVIPADPPFVRVLSLLLWGIAPSGHL